METVKSKHTPGPWEVVTDPDGCYHIKAVDADGESVYPAKINGNPEYDTTHTANANLIAAAPNLLTSLQEFIAHLEKHATYGLNAEESAMLRRADAAIAKADL